MPDTATAPTADARAEHMARAFKYVDPTYAARRTDWRGPIRCSISSGALRVLAREGFTLDDLCDAIRWLTATEPKVTATGDGVLIEAIGYRAGPAGP